MRFLLLFLGLGVFVGLVLVVAKYLGVVPNAGRLYTTSKVGTPPGLVVDLVDSSADSWIVETVAQGLEVPWSFVFTSPSRMLVTERKGTIRVIENGILQPLPLHVFTEVSSTSEEGLMGMALDPNYQQNKLVYVSLAYLQEGNMFVKVLRFTDQGTSIGESTVLVDSIPAARNHAGSRIRFGPDGKLYITTGDATQKALAQQLDSLAGKVLRMNADGTIPSDNPFPNSPVFSFGHRNPQGLDWHPKTSLLYSTEHGPSLFDGPAGGDEVNLIEAGKNYGWPLVSHTKTREGTVAPLMVYTPAEAPASGTFYRATSISDFHHNFFFGALKGEGLVRIVFDEENPKLIDSQEKLFANQFGRIREGRGS